MLTAELSLFHFQWDDYCDWKVLGFLPLEAVSSPTSHNERERRQRFELEVVCHDHLRTEDFPSVEFLHLFRFLQCGWRCAASL
jgi:hypothetical protein